MTRTMINSLQLFSYFFFPSFFLYFLINFIKIGIDFKIRKIKLHGKEIKLQVRKDSNL